MDKIKLFTDWVPRIQSNKKLEPPKFAETCGYSARTAVFRQNLITIFDFFLKFIKNTYNFPYFSLNLPEKSTYWAKKGWLETK